MPDAIVQHQVDEATPLVVATYNVHRCIGGDGRYDPGRVIAVLADLRADVICLQEVSAREEGDEQAALFARGLGYDVFTGATLVHRAGAVSNAVLTRLPILAGERLDLTVPLAREPRGAIIVRLLAGRRDMLVVCTHFGLGRTERAIQLERLLSTLDVDTNTVVLAGDFNEWAATGPCNKRLALKFGPAPAPRTFPARLPIFCLDRIYAGPGAVLRSIEVARTLAARRASDHLPVRGLVELLGTVRAVR